MARDLGLRHFRVMFERQRGDGLAALNPPADSAEADDGADIGTPLGERRYLAADVEIGFLDADGHIGGHGIIAMSKRFICWSMIYSENRFPLSRIMLEPPVIGGKKAISRAPAISVSGLTCAWPIAA